MNTYFDLNTALKTENFGMFIENSMRYLLTCQFEKNGTSWLENIIVETPYVIDRDYIEAFIKTTIAQNELDKLVITFIWKFE